jgi:hypothetical protein
MGIIQKDVKKSDNNLTCWRDLIATQFVPQRFSAAVMYFMFSGIHQEAHSVTLK